MKCWLIRYTLRNNEGNGWALVLAKSASTAAAILQRQGHLVEVGYNIYSAEEFTQIEIDRRCCRDTILSEGLVTKGDTGIGITDVRYDKDSSSLTINLSDGSTQSFELNIDMEPLDVDDIIQAMYWDGK